MKRIKNCLLLCFITFGIANLSYSQNYKWIKQVGDKSTDINPICKILPDGQSVIAWQYSQYTKIDSLKVTPKGYSLPYVLAFLNKEGKAKWIWKPDSCYSKFTISTIGYSKSLGKIYVCGNFNFGSIINNQSYKGNTNGFIIRLDTNGTFENIYTLSLDTSGVIFEGFEVSDKNDIFLGIYFSQNKTYPNSNLKISSLKFSINKSGNFVLKLDKDLNPIKASDPMYGVKSGKIHIRKNANNILSTCIYQDTFVINGKYYFNGNGIFSAYVTYLDTNLNFKKVVKLYTTGSNNSINAVKTLNNGDVVIGGGFRDSIGIINFPQTYKGYNLPLFACLDSNGKLKWVKLPLFKYGDLQSAFVYDLDVADDYILGGGIFYGNTNFDDFALPDSLGSFWFFKLDARGNILWMRRVTSAKKYKNQNLTSISFNGSRRALMAGFIIDTVRLNNQIFHTNGAPDILLLKIHDIEIYRGQVSKGPYCAGDTLKIPYTKEGDFNTGNQFIAQLSDADGNFTGKERELGRITSTTAGTIKGPLPMFEVESSPHYRIRIISTNPVVQSYYKYDTLRLLIYSKDKANPGQPETICQGDSLQLKAVGGTKWTWSPKYNMNDSTLKKPWVWPSKTTTYKIIIADSSGCGKPDTAFKKIIVRWPLKVSVVSKDTAVCDSKPIKLPAWFSGGDSLNYQWQWFTVSKTKKIWKPLNTGKLKLSDTLAYTPTATLYTNDTLAIVLKDNCTNKNDTAIIIIRLLKPSVITNKFKDTLVCKGTVINYKATVWFAQNYQWQWRDITNNTILSTTNSLSLIANTTLKIKLTLTNGCTIDSNVFMLNVHPSLKANILTTKGSLNDTTLCSGQSLSLFAIGKGGAGKGYVYSWIWNGNIVSKSDTLRIKPTSTSILSLILNDNCTKAADTLSKTITIIETPKADFTWDLACSRTLTNFKYMGSKPIQTFAWNFNNEATSNLENPSHKFAAIGTSITVLAVTSGNGCVDTIKKTLDIKPQSKAAFTTTDVCENESAVFINKSQDATSYIWKFGDGLKSYVESPKHLYTIGGVSQTFNVTLVAVVSGGCSDSVVNSITVNSNPISDFSYTTNKNSVDFKATQLGNTFYKWKFGNGDSATSSSNNYTYTYSKLSGKYTACLKAINTANCFSETCKTINISIGVSPISKPTGFKIYPNPNGGSFTVEIENPEKDIAIDVYNLIGEKIGLVESIPSQSHFHVDLNLSNGIYLVKVRNGERIYSKKVIVAK